CLADPLDRRRRDALGDRGAGLGVVVEPGQPERGHDRREAVRDRGGQLGGRAPRGPPPLLRPPRPPRDHPPPPGPAPPPPPRPPTRGWSWIGRPLPVRPRAAATGGAGGARGACSILRRSITSRD